MKLSSGMFIGMFMKGIISESVKYSIKKAIQYRANLISWFIADLAMYTATFLGYYFLTQKISVFGDYSANEVLLYISCYFLINNFFAILFSESVSRFGHNVLAGYFDYDILKPQPLIKYYVLKHLNLPAVCATPFLIGLNLYCLKLCNTTVTIQYVISVFCGVMAMGFVFFIVYSLALFGIRSEGISAVCIQLLSIGEKPDTVFPRIVRNVLIYGIPIFLFSAVPTRIALNKLEFMEMVWMFVSPVFYYAVLKILLRQGMKKYQSGVE